MSGFWWLAGFASFPVLGLTVIAILDAKEPGLEIHCGRCDYETGDMKTTPRFVARVRWGWHKAAHRLGVQDTTR